MTHLFRVVHPYIVAVPVADLCYLTSLPAAAVCLWVPPPSRTFAGNAFDALPIRKRTHVVIDRKSSISTSVQRFYAVFGFNADGL